MRITPICLISILVTFLFYNKTLGQRINPDTILFDFEEGTLKNWIIEGEIPFFEGKATHTNQIKTWSRRPLGFKGNYYLETGANAGRHDNNPDGRAVSPEFIISRNFLNFYLAGEVHPEVRVGLIIHDTVAREAFGNNFYDLILRGWEVSEYKSQKARFFVEDKSDMRSLIRVDHLFLSDIAPPKPQDWINIPDRQRSELVCPGEFKLFFKSEEIGEDWKITKSTVVFGPDQKWHLFASAYKGDNQWKPENWKHIIHATSDKLTSSSWQYEGIALAASDEYGEDFLWDPFVLVHQEKFYMFYVGAGNPWSGWYTPPGGKHNLWHEGNSGDQGPFFMYVATSADGKNWERKGEDFKGKKGVAFVDNPFAFAPYVTKIDDQWVMYYASTTEESIYARHAIGYRTSKDLIHWSDRKIALEDWSAGEPNALEGVERAASPWPEHSFITNPYVTNRGNSWYLFAGPIDNNNLSRYHVLRIYSSDNPYKWSNHKEAIEKNKRIFVDGGARPVLDVDGKWYITTTNDMSGGVWLAPLYWNIPPEKSTSK